MGHAQIVEHQQRCGPQLLKQFIVVNITAWVKGATQVIEQIEIAAHGGKNGKPEAKSNYGYLDGHAETNDFERVYADYYTNRFFPRVAK